MRNILKFFKCSGCFLLFLACAQPRNVSTDYVDPFIGTSGDHGQMFPGATLPFGMVKLSPDTYPSSLNKLVHSGYNYLDKQILGFSHVRLGGEGCDGIGGNILILPRIGKIEIAPEKYAAWYDKKSEIAKPGSYQVTLLNPSIDCALTVTEHGGLHQYVFPNSDNAHILIDLSRGFTEVRDAYLKVSMPDRVEGFVTAGHLCHSLHNYTIHFSVKFSKPFKSFSIWKDGVMVDNASALSGAPSGFAAVFDTKDKERISVKVGLSTIDVEHARSDSDLEIPDWNFDRYRDNAELKWRHVLDKIKVRGNETYKKLFYTAFYHSFIIPINTTSHDGSYRGTDTLVHKADHHIYYEGFSLWDTFRTKYPLLSLVEPAILQDIVRSFVKVYEQGDQEWPFPTIRREHMLAIIADAYAKGIRNFNVEQAYQGMRRDAFEMRAEFANAAAGVRGKLSDAALQAIYLHYDSLGFMPKRPDRTLENSYDNWCVAQMAKGLGKNDDYQKFMRRAHFYQNVWDPQIGFFRARQADGTWLPFPDPRVIDESYVYEATMWQWRWFVLHDVPGLINLIGGREKFVAQLDSFFVNDLYNHANEQDLHAAWLFNFAGAPWLTQKWIHKILAEPMTQLYGGHRFYDKPYHGLIYKPSPDSYLPEMDDDCGTMSSWYVLAAMGLYQVSPGEPVYQLTAPLFERITIALDQSFYSGKSFSLVAKNLSEKNVYIQSARLNGKLYNKPWIAHQDIIKGGDLVFEMGPEPQKNWGSKLEDVAGKK